MANINIKLGKKIRSLRRAKKLTQEDLAYQAKIDYSYLNEIEDKHEQIQNRLDRLYDDKLDGKISEEFYNQKFKQYTKEKEGVLETIQNHSQASNKYFELGVNLFELSQRAREIYLKAKKTKQTDNQRQLINLIFTNLILNEGRLSFYYTKAFQLLSEAVKASNSSKMLKTQDLDNKIFEPQEKVDITGQMPTFYSLRPNWLRR